jgi:alcohol dehydrogenase class IV
MSLHHKLCHTLGGSFNMPHAETHTIILPHALAYNAPNIPEVMKKLAEVLPGSDGDAIKGLNLLLDRLGVKKGLKDFGFKEERRLRLVIRIGIQGLLRRSQLESCCGGRGLERRQGRICKSF